MRTHRFHFSRLASQTYILIGLAFFLLPGHGFSQNVRTREEIVRIAAIE